MNLSSSFALLGKLSSAEQSESLMAQNEYEHLFATVNYQLVPLLERSDYDGKSKLKTVIDSELDICQLFLRYPFLASRTIVGVFPGKSREGLAFMKSLTKSSERPLFSKIRNLPCILYNSADSETIHVTNNAGNVISISVNELELMLNLYKQNIKIEDILQSCAISEDTGFQHINYIFFPPFARKNAPDYRQLAELCSAYFVFYSDLAECKSLHDVVISSKGQVYIVYNREHEKECHKLAQSMSRDYSSLHFFPLPIEEISQVLEGFNQPTNNCVFCETFLLSILKLAISQNASDNQHSMSAKVLGEDSFLLEANEVIKQTLQTLRNAELEMSENAKTIISELKKNRKELMQSTLDLCNALFRFDTDTITVGLNPMLVTARYGEICGQIILSALKLKEYDTALQYINIMENVNHPHAYLYTLYYQDAKGETLSENSLTMLAKEAPRGNTIIRGKIKFAAEIHLSDSERNDLASRLSDECSAEEMFFRACKVETVHNMDEAESLYQAAFQKGSIDAGKKLAQHYWQTKNFRALKSCADRLIPEAAFLYAQSCTQVKQKITYLHIAVAQHYNPAILYYADMLYTELVNLDFEEKRIPPRQIGIATKLFRHMVDQGVYGSKNRYGVLLYLCGNYQDAKRYLDSGKDGKYYLGKMYAEGHGVSIDRDRAIKYLKESNTPQANKLLNKLLAQKEKESRESSQSHSYNSSSSYQSTVSDYSSSSDGCFITTATCQAKGKSDDCEELTAFRHYRDNTLLQSETGKALVEEYYRIAPGIVEFIQNDPECEKIYQYLYDHYIASGYKLLLKGEGDAARQLYCEAVLALAERYGVEISLDKSMLH